MTSTRLLDNLMAESGDGLEGGRKETPYDHHPLESRILVTLSKNLNSSL